MFYINLLLEIYPETMTVNDLLGLIGGTAAEVKGYLRDGSLRGTMVDGQWEVKRADVGDFIKAHQHQSETAADLQKTESTFRALGLSNGFTVPKFSGVPALAH
jgi:hypothetical protein